MKSWRLEDYWWISKRALAVLEFSDNFAMLWRQFSSTWCQINIKIMLKKYWMLKIFDCWWIIGEELSALKLSSFQICWFATPALSSTRRHCFWYYTFYCFELMRLFLTFCLFYENEYQWKFLELHFWSMTVKQVSILWLRFNQFLTENPASIFKLFGIKFN